MLISEMAAMDLLEMAGSMASRVVGGLYLLVVAGLTFYGLHRSILLARYRRPSPAPPTSGFSALPAVTVQVPMFNEAPVAQRVIDAVCQLDYPPKRLQIQILDDSTDRSADLVRHRVAHWQAQGIRIELHHRLDRRGYKAGALADGLKTAGGTLIALFDADFVPKPDFLKRMVAIFNDPKVGCVQARWDHLNRSDNFLTRAQAIFRDAHSFLEQHGRHRSGLWIYFNGTAGIWRRAAIESAGGWQHDTLSEDVDLSYRAQLAGWKFVYLPLLGCPAELPPQIEAFRIQQHRWCKGITQVAMKLLGKILRSNASWRVKLEVWFHLTQPLVNLLITLLGGLLYPVLLLNFDPARQGSAGSMMLGVMVCLLGTVSGATFFAAGQQARRTLGGTGASGAAMLLQIPWVMALGIGMSIHNSFAVLEALLGHESPFVRTPKYNGADPADTQLAGSGVKRWLPVVETACGLYLLGCTAASLSQSWSMPASPFLLLLASGYLYVGFAGLRARFRNQSQKHKSSDSKVKSLISNVEF